MIRVPFETMVFAYLLAGLATVGGCFALDAWRRRRARAKGRRFRLRCARCALEWEDLSAEPLPKCPRCGSLNERTPPPTL